jgi:hypothetical protein
MKIGDYEISESTTFYKTGDDELPITINAGGDIPRCAIWIDGEPKAYTLPEGGFILSSNFEEFKSLLTLE